MKRPGIVLFGVALAACAPGRETAPPAPGAGAAPPGVQTERASAPAIPSAPALPPPTSAPTCRVSSDAIGPLRLGATLEAVRASHPQVAFSRTSDGEGVALVEATVDGESLAIAYAGEDEAEAPVDLARAIEHLETFSPACATAEGVRPGSAVEAAVAAYGPVRGIHRSEIESREYIEFARQPPGLQFRLDYSGEFAEGQTESTRHAPGAKIFSIAVSRP